MVSLPGLQVEPGLLEGAEPLALRTDEEGDGGVGGGGQPCLDCPPAPEQKGGGQ